LRYILRIVILRHRQSIDIPANAIGVTIKYNGIDSGIIYWLEPAEDRTIPED